MKKITLLSILCMVLTIPIAMGQSSLSSSSGQTGPTVVNGPAGITTANNGQIGNLASQVITYNASQNITPGLEIACASPTSFRDNSMYVDFDLANDFGISDDFDVSSVEFAIGTISTPTSFPITVKVWSSVGDFPNGALTLQSTDVYTATNADAATIVSVGLAATIPAGEKMVVELILEDDGTDTHNMRFGCNDDGFGDESWIKAVDCGAPDPTEFAVLGLSQDIVLNVVGEEATGGGGSITYCTSSGNSTTFENITNVTYGGINNTTTTHSGYNDFTSQVANVNQGETEEISVTITADGSDYVYAFIDWDQNGTLDDAGEVYTLATSTSSNGPHTMNITVPAGAPLGDTRMRVKVGWNQSTPDPCGTFSYGEIEDYTVNVKTPPIGDPPVVSCPSDIMADTDPGECGAVVNFAGAIAIDTEDGQITAVQTMGPASGAQFPTGDTIVEYTATDSDGNEASCQFTVTVTDMEAPEALCQSLTLELMGGSSVSITPADIDNGSSDNCSIVDYSLDKDTFTCADAGENTVTLTVTDNEGNSSTCTATVTIEDNVAPEITCIGEPGIFNILEEFEGASIPAGWTTVLDAGSQDWTFGSGDMPGGDPFPTNAAIFDDDAAGSGVNVASLLSPVYDISGAISSDLNFDYSLQDFVGDGELSVEVWDGAAWQEILFITEDTTPTNLGSTDMMPYANPDFQVRFTYDDNGGYAWGAGVDNFALNYELSTSPPLDVTLDASGNATIPADDLIQTVNETCGYVVTIGGPATGGGSTTETLETTFAGGNGQDGNMFDIVAINEVTINSFDVNIDTGAKDMEVYYKPGTWEGFEEDASAWTLVGSANVTSAGEGVPTPLNLSLGQTIAAGDTGAFYVTTTSGGINYTNGTANGTVFASDANIEFLEGSGKSYPFGSSTFDARVFNGNIIYDVGPQIDNDVSFDCSMLGENEVEVFVTDNSGNYSSCTATVNVVDITAPVITCAGNPGPTSIIEEFEDATIPDGWSTVIEVGAQDWTFGSGDMATGGDFPTNAAIFDDNIAGNGEVNLVRLLSPIYNISGSNTASVSFDYALQEYIGGGELIVEVWDGAVWQEILFVDVDTDPTNTGAIDVLPFLNPDLQVRFTFDDEGEWGWGAGIDNFKLDYEVTTVTAIDIPLGADGTATIDPNSLIQSVDEACGIATVASDITDVSCADIGTPMTITIFASDASGNIASCTAEINVVDVTGPEVTCPEDQTVDPGTGNLYYEVPDYFANGEAFATDSCTDPVTITSQDPAPGELLSDDVYTVTLTAEDDYGNVGTCTFELTVESVLGMDDNSLSNSITMYPNPADSQVTISNKSDIALENATIYDINGKLINQYNLRNMQGQQVIDVSALATGVYVVQIISETSSVSKRLIIK